MFYSIQIWQLYDCAYATLVVGMELPLHIDQTSRTYTDAVDACSNLGGHIVKIDSSDKFDQITWLLSLESVCHGRLAFNLLNVHLLNLNILV